MDSLREKPRDRSRKKWIDGVKEDLKSLGGENQKRLVQNRERCRNIVVTIETYREQLRQEKKKTVLKISTVKIE